ncbi:MAG: xylulokinase [Phycisphaerae bacterium]|nr:MAG: xylulokinase [Phycisphaerae bacterium]
MFLGLDLGTSAAKAILIRADGAVAGVGSAAYPISQPHDRWSEQNPLDWWAGAINATRAACAGVEPDAVLAIGLTGQMHGLVLVDAEGLRHAGTHAVAPVRPAMLWNDQRTDAECATIERTLGGRAACVRATGNAALPGFTLPKMLWVRGHEPETWAKAERVFLPKDYLRLVMTAETATDVGDAAGMLLIDPATRGWADAVLSAFDIDRRSLPTLRESGSITGDLTVWASGQLGLKRSTPVIAGSGDNQTAAVGAGVVAPGTGVLSLGTSGVLYIHTDAPRLDLGSPPGRLHVFPAADGVRGTRGGWCSTACMLSAGGALAWAAGVLAPNVAIDDLLREAAVAPAGCDGLLFLPHLTGERCPYADPTARGAWVGLTSRHTRGHLVRAVLEGVALTNAMNLDLMRGAGVGLDSLRVVGGGARSPLWLAIHAAAMNTSLTCLASDEGPALGAAMLAGVGVGAWDTVREAAAACVRTTDTIEPDQALVTMYGEQREKLSRVYHALHADSTTHTR